VQPPEERSATRRLARGFLWPLRRFFDPRFQGLSEQVGVVHADLLKRLDERVDELLTTLEQDRAASRRAEASLLASIRELRRVVEASIEAGSEEGTIIGRSLTDLLGEVERLRERLDALDREAVGRKPG
jgi:chromosome segregation ATPase